MTALIKSWTHPTTGQIRLYITHGGAAKVWLVKRPNGGWDAEYKLARDKEPEQQFDLSLLGRRYIGALDYAIASAEQAITQYFHGRRLSDLTFAELVQVAGTEPPPHAAPVYEDEDEEADDVAGLADAEPGDPDDPPWDVDEPTAPAEQSPASGQSPAYLDRLAYEAEDKRVAGLITTDDINAYAQASDRPPGPAKRKHRRRITAAVAARTGSDTVRVGRLLVDRYTREAIARER